MRTWIGCFRGLYSSEGCYLVMRLEFNKALIVLNGFWFGFFIVKLVEKHQCDHNLGGEDRLSLTIVDLIIVNLYGKWTNEVLRYSHMSEAEEGDWPKNIPGNHRLCIEENCLDFQNILSFIWMFILYTYSSDVVTYISRTDKCCTCIFTDLDIIFYAFWTSKLECKTVSLTW